MSNHVKAARTHVGIVVLYLLAISLFVFLGWLLPKQRSELLEISVLFGLMAGLHFLAYWGAQTARNWARILTLVLAVPLLFAFPIGTAIGGWLIYCGLGRWDSAQVS